MRARFTTLALLALVAAACSSSTTPTPTTTPTTTPAQNVIPMVLSELAGAGQGLDGCDREPGVSEDLGSPA